MTPSTCFGASGAGGQLLVFDSDDSPVRSGDNGPAFFGGIGTSTCQLNQAKGLEGNSHILQSEVHGSNQYFAALSFNVLITFALGTSNR